MHLMKFNGPWSVADPDLGVSAQWLSKLERFEDQNGVGGECDEVM